VQKPIGKVSLLPRRTVQICQLLLILPPCSYSEALIYRFDIASVFISGKSGRRHLPAAAREIGHGRAGWQQG
jgi:hypothetical protein